MPVTALRKRAGDEEERRTKTKEGGGALLLKSCHVALIHPASLESGKGPEGLSQDRGPGSHRHAKPHTDICMHTCFSLAHTCTHTYDLSLPHTHTGTHKHSYTDDTGTWRSAGAVWGIENCLLRKALAN